MPVHKKLYLCKFVNVFLLQFSFNIISALRDREPLLAEKLRLSKLYIVKALSPRNHFTVTNLLPCFFYEKL